MLLRIDSPPGTNSHLAHCNEQKHHRFLGSSCSPLPSSFFHDVFFFGIERLGEQRTWAVAGPIIGGPFLDVCSRAASLMNDCHKLFTPTFSLSGATRFEAIHP